MKARYFLFLVLLPLVTGAQAGPREDVLSGAVRCAGITEDRIWLDCYYGAAQPMRSELGLPAAPATQVNRVPLPPGVTVRQAPPPRKKDFLDQVFSGATRKLQLASYSFDRDGMFTVTLSNGDVWEQVSGDVNFAHWRGAASGYNVTLSEGGFGRGDLWVEKDGATYDVRRVK